MRRPVSGNMEKSVKGENSSPENIELMKIIEDLRSQLKNSQIEKQQQNEKIWAKSYFWPSIYLIIAINTIYLIFEYLVAKI